MQNQKKLTAKQIELVKRLDRYKKDVWDSETTEQIVSIAKKVIDETKHETPDKILFANGFEYVNEKGKKLTLDLLIVEASTLGQSFSDLKDQKFAISSTIVLLMGVFAMVGTEDLFRIIEN